MLNQQRRSNSPTPEPSAVGGGQREELTLALDGGSGSLTVAELPEVKQFKPQGNQTWRWLLIALMGCIATSGTAIGAFVWLINLPPTADCNNPASISTDRAQLYCAQLAAEAGNLDDILASLELVGRWDQSHPLHYEVQPLVEQWSQVVLQEARQQLSNSDLNRATELIDYIPVYSPAYETAQTSLQEWNSEWDQGNAIWQTAQAALKNQDWATASQQLPALAELRSQHWRVNQVQALAEQIRLEQRSRKQLQAAVQLASQGGVAQLGGALRTLSQIDDATYAYEAAQPYMDRWSDWLLNLGLDKWYASELEEAISLGRNAAVNPSRAKAALELVWLSEARQMAQESLGPWRTSPDQLIKLYRAMVLANQIPADSAYYPQAQSSVVTWRSHLADLGTLQLAQLPGRVQKLETLKLAIGQAAQVPLGNPRRQQAQTMIAHWRLEAERLEDRPLLTQAHQLAATDTIEGLQQAIATASQIPMNRALRNEAQSWIYVWKNQIEELEDRPTLMAARKLAAEGRYSQAIAEASNIRAGRAIFDEAQAAIAGWRREIRALEQARQRSLNRSAARNEAEARTPAPVLTPIPTADGASSAPVDDDAASPSPVAPAPVRQPLPHRIDTVPGNRPPTRTSNESLPEPVQPIPSGFSSEPGNGADPQAVPSAQPNSPPVLRPLPAPLPVDVAPPIAPAPSLPAPAAPAPPLPVAPRLAPQPQPVPQFQNDASVPNSVLQPPEAAVPVKPSVSAAPRPEQLVSLKTSKPKPPILAL
jgi:hypothetical protein